MLELITELEKMVQRDTGLNYKLEGFCMFRQLTINRGFKAIKHYHLNTAKRIADCAMDIKKL